MDVLKQRTSARFYIDSSLLTAIWSKNYNDNANRTETITVNCSKNRIKNKLCG